MKVGFVQNCPEFGNIQANLDRIAKMLAGREADLLVLPELFSTGYRFKNMNETRQYAESVPDGLTTNFLISQAKIINTHRKSLVQLFGSRLAK